MSTASFKPFDEVRETLDAIVASSNLALRAMGGGPVAAMVNIVHWRVLSYKSKQVASRLEVISKQLREHYDNYIAFDRTRKGFYGLTEEDRRALAYADVQCTLQSMERDIEILRRAFPKTAARMQMSVDASMEICRRIARVVPPSVKAGKSNKPADLIDLGALENALHGVR